VPALRLVDQEEAQPRHATEVPAGARGAGAGVTAKIAAMMGTPLMPWQHRAAELLEARSDDGAARRYPFVLLTVPRQAGKSLLMLATAVARCMKDPAPHLFWYTAQTGNHAVDRWGELARTVTEQTSPFAGLGLAVRWTNGSQILRFPNGSTCRPFPPTRDSLHGRQSDTTVIDEGFSFDPVRGVELLQAIGPSQATRRSPQTILVSTMGDAQSTWLHSWIDRGRAGDAGIGYLEYGIGDDGDPGDLDAIAAAHPAVGHTITREFLAGQARVMDPLEFARAFGNARTASNARVIDHRAWSGAATTRLLPDGAPSLAADVALDRSRSAIVACRLGVLEVVESRPGTDWVVGRMRELVGRHRPAAVAVPAKGPAAAIADALTLAGVTLTAVSDVQYATACAAFLDGIGHGTLAYRLHPNLDASVAAAAQRRYGDAWVWSRRTASAPICELTAATLAAYLDQHRPAPAPAPRVFAG